MKRERERRIIKLRSSYSVIIIIIIVRTDFLAVFLTSSLLLSRLPSYPVFSHLVRSQLFSACILSCLLPSLSFVCFSLSETKFSVSALIVLYWQGPLHRRARGRGIHKGQAPTTQILCVGKRNKTKGGEEGRGKEFYGKIGRFG